MIQVCSRCGTRWNVRDRQRSWCPRCQGTLQAPTADPAEQQWGQRPAAGAGAAPPRLPQGFRWIAVRPGAAPPQRRRPQPLGPTPRYSVIPRWGLVDHVEPHDQHAADAARERGGPSVGMVRTTLLVTAVLLGLAAFIHLIRYVLLLVNRAMLLHPLVAGIATWLGVALSVLASFAVVGSAVVLTNWLIARREGAYALNGTTDPRSAWEILVGCLIPLANLFLAPVYVIELARAEGRLTRLRRDIVLWWCVWIVSSALMVWSVATSFTRDTQGIADNTVTTIIAYLAGLAALVLAGRVFLGFERTPVDRPAKRWVIVPDDTVPDAGVPHDGVPGLAPTAPEPSDAEAESDVPAESRQREPVA